MYNGVEKWELNEEKNLQLHWLKRREEDLMDLMMMAVLYFILFILFDFETFDQFIKFAKLITTL